MSDAPAWSALALSIANSTALGVAGLQRRKRRLAAGPSQDIRAALEAARHGFQHLVTVGGATSEWFLTDPRPLPEQRLSDLAKRTRDARLAAMLADVGQSCRETFARAHPRRSARIIVPGMPAPPSYRLEDEQIDQANARVAQAAREGLDRSEAALDRLNDLEAKL